MEDPGSARLGLVCGIELDHHLEVPGSGRIERPGPLFDPDLRSRIHGLPEGYAHRNGCSSFGALACPACDGGRFKLVSRIAERDAVARISRSISLPTRLVSLLVRS